MKVIANQIEAVNVIVSKDTRRNLYIAQFDARQIDPRVSVGSTWIAHDRIYDRRFLMRVVEIGYNEDFDLKQILPIIRQSPNQPFDARGREYYCSEKVWLSLEGEFKGVTLKEVHDQPTVLQTFLTPTTRDDNFTIAAPNLSRGFIIGNLRSGSTRLEPVVTLEDRFMGHRTVIVGTSGYGKSTLVRNIARYWIENTKYGKIIDDLKGEYVEDITNQKGEIVYGLAHHPLAKQNLYLLTSRPRRFEGTNLRQRIADIIPLAFDIDDIPPDSLNEVATHITPAQRHFLEMYQEKEGLFRLILRDTEDGSPETRDWHQHFKGFIVATKTGRERIKDQSYMTDLSDFDKSSYVPVFSVRKHLKRLQSRPFINTEGRSCLPVLHRLLRDGATIILDKAGLTDSDKSIVSTVIASEFYKHNERYSSGDKQEQEKVIPFVYLVEEAHLLLSRERAHEGSVFVNFAKTGRGFDIGLVAVTQRPSSIDDNILSQSDNYITFRLTNEQDVKDLIKAESMFQGYEGDIRTMRQGAAVTVFGEPAKVQPIQVFAWTQPRASTLLSSDEEPVVQNLRARRENGSSPGGKQT